MRVVVVQAAIGLSILLNATIAQANPAGDRLISAPQFNAASLNRFNSQDFFLKGQEKLEAEVRRLSYQRLLSEGMLRGNGNSRVQGDRLLCVGVIPSVALSPVPSTATPTCGDSQP